MRPLKRSAMPLVWGAGLGQTMLDAQGLAKLIELVLSSRPTALGADQPVGELLAVIGQYFGDLDRAGLGERLEESAGGGSAFAGLDLDEHPTGGAVDSHEQITATGFIGHLREVFDVYVHPGM